MCLWHLGLDQCLILKMSNVVLLLNASTRVSFYLALRSWTDRSLDRSILPPIHPSIHPSIHPFNQFHSYMHPCSHACIHAYLHPYYIPPTTYLLPSIHRFMHASMHPSFMHKCVHTTRGIHVSMPPACILPKFFYKQFWSDKDLQDWRNLTAFVLCESCRTRLAAILRPVACS